MELTESSTTTAEGPGIIDYEEWELFYYEITAKLKNLKDPAQSDIQKMFENTQALWIQYSNKSLAQKKHNETLYTAFSDSKRMVEKYITMASLRGMHT